MRKYEGKAFKNWNGWIMRVADHRAAGIKYSDHAIYIYLKMEPTFTPMTQPDLILTLSSDVVHEHLELVSNLKHGEEILFNSTYHMSRKNNAEDKHLHGFDIKKTGKPFEYKVCNVCHILKKDIEDFDINQTDAQGRKTTRPSCKT